MARLWHVLALAAWCLAVAAAGPWALAQPRLPPDVVLKIKQQQEQAAGARAAAAAPATKASAASAKAHPRPYLGDVSDFPPAQRSQARTLLGEFLDASDPAARRRGGEGLLALGPAGVRRVQTEALRRLPHEHNAYLAAFYARARALGAAKLAKADHVQLRAWQAQFNSVRGAQLTKEALHATAGPAMQKMRQALCVTVRQVLESSAALRTQRASLVALGELAAQVRQQIEAKSAGGKAGQPVLALPGASSPRGAGPNAAPANPAASARADLPPQPQPGWELGPPDDRAPGEDGAPPTRLDGEEKLLSMMGLAMLPADRRVFEDNWRIWRQVSHREAVGVADLNVMRVLAGLRALRLDVRLCQAARGHSRDMVERHFFAHNSPVPGKHTPWDRARLAGTTANAENIAAGTRSSLAANQMWFFSPGHHRNMFGSHSRVGLGGWDDHWTMDLGN